MPAFRNASSISGQTLRCASTYSSIRSGRTRRTKATRWVTSETSRLVGALNRRGPALAGDFVPVATLAEGEDRILGDADLVPQPRQQRPHIRLERVDENAMGAQHVPLALRAGQPVRVDEQRLGVRGLDVHDRLDHRVDLALDVVRLVDHE